MNYDITFCSKRNCKNKECLRNQNNYNLTENRLICISMFTECEHWKGGENEK